MSNTNCYWRFSRVDERLFHKMAMDLDLPVRCIFVRTGLSIRTMLAYLLMRAVGGAVMAGRLLASSSVGAYDVLF